MLFYSIQIAKSKLVGKYISLFKNPPDVARYGLKCIESKKPTLIWRLKNAHVAQSLLVMALPYFLTLPLALKPIIHLKIILILKWSADIFLTKNVWLKLSRCFFKQINLGPI